MADNKDKFNEAMGSVSIPILILDNKWHRLFGKMNPPEDLAAIEVNLPSL